MLHRLLGAGANFVFSRGYRLARRQGQHHGLDAGIVDANLLASAHADMRRFLASARSKEQVLAYELLGTHVGIAIYDSYLRETMEPTIQLASPRFHAIANEAFIILRAVERYFRSRDVKMVVLGHCVYNNWKILSDYALARGVHVFVTYNSRSIPLHDVNANRGLQTTDHSRYKSDFDAWPPEKRASARAAGAALLARRLRGELDPGISYMASSPYASTATGFSVALTPGKRPVVMMLHSFFDSPHIYRHMVFPDFLEWVEATLRFLSTPELRDRYDVLLKPHPNRFPSEDAVIADILARHPHAKLLPSETSNAAVAGIHPACVLTVYGSVVAELSYQRIPVVTCGDNPTSSFRFAFEARSKEEYFDLLRRADSLALDREQFEEIGAFMYMHYIVGQSEQAVSYPFERFAPHNIKEGHERVGNFSFDAFRRLVDAKLRECEVRLVPQAAQAASVNDHFGSGEWNRSSS
jgi:hypothetical protein